LAFVVLTLTAVSTPSGLARGAESEVHSYDGLHPLQNVAADRAWARPDIDLSPYHRILLESGGIRYRPATQADQEPRADGPQAFPLSTDQRQRLESVFREAFLEALAQSPRYELSAMAGPNVMVVRGSLLDVVSHIPPDPSSAPQSLIGAATLLIELVDSESGTVLLRAVDRREVASPDATGQANVEGNSRPVRRLADEWAAQLRAALDQLSERMTLSPAAGS
jgi:hypothetical protein